MPRHAMPIILGIDPGSRITGFGIIRSKGSEYHYVTSGCIRTPKGEFSARLLQIYQELKEIIQQYCPEEAAIEQVFMQTNASSALKLGHARGVAIIAVMETVGFVAEYSPRQIKQAVVGYGAAEKGQVQHMVQRLLHLSDVPQVDAADALAVALCHASSRALLELLSSK